MTRKTSASRRQFLRQTAAVSATAFAAPWVIPSSCFGANERIVTGHIGVGGQGGSNLGAFLKLASPAAVCDVDKTHLAKAAAAPQRFAISATLPCDSAAASSGIRPPSKSYATTTRRNGSRGRTVLRGRWRNVFIEIGPMGRIRRMRLLWPRSYGLSH